MATPSDYRHDPFSDVSTAATFTERHIIPSVSPYVINLNEIPQKNSPSTMTVKAITNVNGSTVTYGSTFAEVAANPSSNEFWPDYNTGADGDENWNTGKLLFNSSNAGQLVEIRYTATGTLAGVKSNRYPAWWLDRGDGSDGDFSPTENVTISGEKNYRSVFIKQGITVTCSDNTYLKVIGCFINLGTIIVNPSGGVGGRVSSLGDDYVLTTVPGSGGASNGGAGKGGSTYYAGGYRISQPGPFLSGSGGGSGGSQSTGGRGGGNIVITCQGFKNQGTIQANGANGGYVNATSGSGGGGGGCIMVACTNNNSSGVLSVNGGAGVSGSAAGEVGIRKIIELGVM